MILWTDGPYWSKSLKDWFDDILSSDKELITHCCWNKCITHHFKDFSVYHLQIMRWFYGLMVPMILNTLSDWEKYPVEFYSIYEGQHLDTCLYFCSLCQHIFNTNIRVVYYVKLYATLFRRWSLVNEIWSLIGSFWGVINNYSLG